MDRARALLAYQGSYERDPDVPEEPSDQALIGALVTADSQMALIELYRCVSNFLGK